MAEKKYDIFISYRRKDTGDKAEHLKDLLERDYRNRVSFDRENLTGIFDVELARRIDYCKDFILVVGKNSFNYSEKDFTPEQVELYKHLGSCSQTDFEKKIVEMGPNAPLDFVRIEIARALNHKGLNIIPIVPEKTEHFNFNETNLPPDIANIKRYEAVFYSDHPDRLFKDIMQSLRPRLASKVRVSLTKILIPCVALILLGICALFWRQHAKKENLRSELEKKYDYFHPYINKNLSITQLQTIDNILGKMSVVKPDSLWMSQFEFTIGQWYGIKGESFDMSQKDIPVTGFSFGEIQLFIMNLYDMTNINFLLPSSEEWEYAARSGSHNDSTLYVGSNNVDAVAWYKDNSNDIIHPSNGQQGKDPNKLDLFDMSGNVGEFCNTPIVSENGNILFTVCGGDYTSSADEVTISAKKGLDSDSKDKATGFRLIIHEQ